MGAPPVPVIFPVSVTVVLVVAPLDTVSVGKFITVGAADILAGEPNPDEFTALTLNECVVFDSPVNVCPVMLCAVTHAPLFNDTSYLIIAAPPLLEGANQFMVT